MAYWSGCSPSRIIRRMRLLLLLLALAGCAPGAAVPVVAPGCALVQLGQLPLEMIADVPVVTAEINGQPVRMVIDTGATFTVVAPRTATRLGLQPTGRPIAMEGAGGRVTAIPVILPLVRIGGAQLQGVPAVVGRALDIASDGVFGVTLLSAFEIDLDVPGRVMTLYAPRRCPTLTPPWTGPFTELPAERSAQGQLIVPIAVNGVELRAVLDTGNSLTFVTRQAALRAGLGDLIVGAAPVARAQTFTAGGTQVRLVQFDRLDVGDTAVRYPVLLVGNLPEAAGDALLGGDFLTTHRVWLALGAGAVFVAREEPSPP